MERNRRLAQRSFVLWMSAYVVTVFVTTWFFNKGYVPQALRIPVGLLPMVPAFVAVFPIVDAYRNQDELQRRVQSEGIVFSFVLTALLTFSYGFLEAYANFPKLSMFFVWPVMAVLWGAVGQPLAARRYR
jgi:hypothetical protein